jgi:cytochrome d ubiquinol oxidase subunit II
MSLDLPFIFMLLMGLSVLAYVILDGFDLGVGILLPLAPRHEHDLMVASIGPFWDANETWLVLGVGILLVAFPRAHGMILTALYLPVAVMLLGLIVRGVAFELRFKATGWHRELWNRLFFVGSLVASIAQGIMLAGVVTGFEQGLGFTLFGLLVGVGLAGAYSFLCANWLIVKNECEVERPENRMSRSAVLFAAAGVAAISLATPFASERILHRWFEWPKILWLSPLPLLTLAALIGIHRSAVRLQRGVSKRGWIPFVLSVWVFVFSFAGLAYSLYPYLVIDRLTIWQAAAAPESLRFVFIGTCIVLPLVIAYTLLSYRVFWGKVKELTYGA